MRSLAAAKMRCCISASSCRRAASRSAIWARIFRRAAARASASCFLRLRVASLSASRCARSFSRSAADLGCTSCLKTEDGGGESVCGLQARASRVHVGAEWPRRRLRERGDTPRFILPHRPPDTERVALGALRASASGASRSDAACHPLPPLPPLPLPLGALPALFPPTARCAARMNEAHTRALAPSSLLGRRVRCRLEGSGHCAGSASREAPASERTPARRRPPAPLSHTPHNPNRVGRSTRRARRAPLRRPGGRGAGAREGPHTPRATTQEVPNQKGPRRPARPCVRPQLPPGCLTGPE